MSLTKHSLTGNNFYLLFNNSRPVRVWLVTSRLGTGISLTFFYSVGSSLVEKYDMELMQVFLPTIVVQPIGYDDAKEILSKMGGRLAPEDWQEGKKPNQT
jgi:hypothetical protein